MSVDLWSLNDHRSTLIPTSSVGQLRPHGHALAAVLAVGPGAVLSHRDAAWLHDLRPGNHQQADVLSTVRARSTAGIRAHHTTVLPPEHVTLVERIPVTSVARTLVDLAGTVPHDHLLKAVDAAERLRTFDRDAVERALQLTACRRGPGHQALRSALDVHVARGVQLTRSHLEETFVGLLEANGLPRPRLNAWVEGAEVDAYWPASGVVAELDGWAFHGTRKAAERDRAKTNDLQLAGLLVLRFTHGQVVHRSAEVVERVARALARRR